MKVLMALCLVAVTLAGCTGGGGDAIKVSAPADPTTQPYTFTAGVSGDALVWDFGDGRPTATGKTVDHVFGVASGTFNVRLSADGETHETRVVIGDGTNAKPSFRVAVPKLWYVTGEEVRFSAAASTDPTADPLLYRWNCFRKGDLAPAGSGHDHGAGGPGFGTLPDQTIGVDLKTPVTAAPDRTVSGDFCGGDLQDGFFYPEATIAGAFATPGLYRIDLVAKDPANPSVSGYFELVVSAPSDRPDPTFAFAWDGTFAGGSGGNLQDLADQLGQNVTLDRRIVSFTLAMPAASLFLNLTHDQEQVSEVSYTLRKGATVLSQGVDPTSFENPSVFLPGTYTVELILAQGAQTAYDASVEGAYVLDPIHKFDLH